MKSFNFKSPGNTKEAAKMATGKTTFIAGGMTLLPAMKLRLAAYSDLINIKKIKSLSGVKVSSKSLRIGATTTHAEVAASKEVGKSIPSLAVLAEGIGDPQVRNRGTIGGSIANNDPAADYPSACLALNATIHTNKRKITADKFFKPNCFIDISRRWRLIDVFYTNDSIISISTSNSFYKTFTLLTTFTKSWEVHIFFLVGIIFSIFRELLERAPTVGLICARATFTIKGSTSQWS